MTRLNSTLLLVVCFVAIGLPRVCFADEPAAVELELALPFRDNMVLQRGINLPIWGTGPANGALTITYGKQSKVTQVCGDGTWYVELDPLEAVQLESPDSVPKGTAMTITVDSLGKESSLTLNNLVVGDVWLCAGQSNIAGKLKGSGTYQGEAADYPGFRHWTPTDEGGWTVCTPNREGAGEFKKTAFYFGRDVYRESLIPIGLIVAAVGGSNIESWLNQEPHETGKNYTKLVEPYVGFGIRGMVWYQGESNANQDTPYRPLLTSLIKGWRDAWGQGDLPFYYVQLPGYGQRKNDPAGKPGWPAIRQDQLETLAVKNTGMAITIDIGDKSVHPPNKVDTGKRLARLALYHDYDKTEQLPSGPLYQSHEIDGAAVRIKFNHAAGLMVAEKEGLSAPTPVEDRPVECFSLKDKQGKWHPAAGRIDGEDLVLTSEHVAEPVAARYAYFAHPAGPLLYNKDGLPASPFTTERAE